MKWIVYHLTLPLVFILSRLPFPLLYGVSNGVFFLLFYVLRYRRKVVQENLQLTLKNRSNQELKRIERSFYRHFCDIFLETLKIMGMDREQLEKRIKIENLDMLQRYEESGRDIIMMSAHYANWEWLTILGLLSKNKAYAAYQRIDNPYFDRLYKRLRSKFNAVPIERNEVAGQLIKDRANGVKFSIALISDQSPMAERARHWASFMGIPVPVFTGGELLAKRFNPVILYSHLDKIKRGHYELRFQLISEQPESLKRHELINQFLRLLETQIEEKPELYFWTHRRWKHRNQAPDQS